MLRRQDVFTECRSINSQERNELSLGLHPGATPERLIRGDINTRNPQLTLSVRQELNNLKKKKRKNKYTHKYKRKQTENLVLYKILQEDYWRGATGRDV